MSGQLDYFISRKTRAYQIYKDIIDYLGAENIVQFMPMSLYDGGKYVDLLNPEITFDTALGYILPNRDSLLLESASIEANGLVQSPKTANTVGGSGQALDGTTTKLYQRISPIAAALGFYTLSLKRVGTLAAATVKAGLYTESTTEPGTLVTNGESVVFACSSIVTTAFANKGLNLAISPTPQFNQNYYIVLEYANSTGVDASNYILWEYDATSNAYGQKRGTYASGAWTAHAGENHKFAVYGNELALSDDYSFIVVGKLLAKDLAVHRTLIHMYSNTGTGNYGFIVRCDIGGYIVVGANSAAEWLGSSTIYRYPLYEFAVIGATFEKAGSTGKLLSYLNGQLMGSSDGTATSGPVTPMAQPMAIGTRNTEGVLSERYTGLIDFVMRTNIKLTAAQMAKVNALLRTI